uniref:Uncharacterized protein n=1 Tax=Leviviridae sp. TaxID=2027243 RepID=A0A514CZL5_9VIRU|nr:MAG: hypothetical protein H1Rhizo25519_000001 [Leviviridae sp.]
MFQSGKVVSGKIDRVALDSYIDAAIDCLIAPNPGLSVRDAFCIVADRLMVRYNLASGHSLIADHRCLTQHDETRFRV